MANEKTISRELRSGVLQMSINDYQDIFPVGDDTSFGPMGPAPLFPRLNTPSQISISTVFFKFCSLCQPYVSPMSAHMSFYEFVMYCLYYVIFLCQPCQPISQHYIHVRACACARGNFVYGILRIYFEFVRKWSDRADAPSARAICWSDIWADIG